MDASSDWIDQQYGAVAAVLATLGAATIPRLLVFNKTDLVKDPFARKKISLAYPDALFVSAFSKEDLRMLKERIGGVVAGFEREQRMADIIQQKTKSLISKPSFLHPPENAF
jgi:50S ribosomal subunit-associated GTPase HflX